MMLVGKAAAATVATSISVAARLLLNLLRNEAALS